MNIKKNKKYNFTKKNKKNNKNSLKKIKKIKIKKTENKNKNKNKKIQGGTLYLEDKLDQTLQYIVSIGFEFESAYSSYLLYDKNQNTYYLGDTYDIPNGRRKDEKLFQIKNIQSLSSDVADEEFYSQEDDITLPTELNEYFQQLLQYYLGDDEYDDKNHDFIQRDAMKIIKDGTRSDLIVELSNKFDIYREKYPDINSYLKYRHAEYVVTFYDIQKIKNPIMKYFGIASNMLLRYLKNIEEYNERIGNDVNISVSLKGNREGYDLIKDDFKIYKIPPEINEYLPSEQEEHYMEIGRDTIYDSTTENKIMPNLEYNYLIEEDVKLSDIILVPQVTIGVKPLQMLIVGEKLINSPENELLIAGLQIVETKLNTRYIQLSLFDKNILSYVYYCSVIIVSMVVNNYERILKYYLTFLMRHKISNFNIFKNINFVNHIIELIKIEKPIYELWYYYYLILLISKDAYYEEIDNISFKMENDGSADLAEYLKIVEENSIILNEFLKSLSANDDFDAKFTDSFVEIYSTWNGFVTKQYPYLETEEHTTPLLFELRYFNSDIKKIIKKYGYDYENPTLEVFSQVASQAYEDSLDTSHNISQLSRKTRKLKIKNNRDEEQNNTEEDTRKMKKMRTVR